MPDQQEQRYNLWYDKGDRWACIELRPFTKYQVCWTHDAVFGFTMKECREILVDVSPRARHRFSIRPITHKSDAERRLAHAEKYL